MSGQPSESAEVHTADDGYCIAECSHGLTSKVCGLEVVRPGKFQCWCDGLSDDEVLAVIGREMHA